jgi:hypothetical protein
MADQIDRANIEKYLQNATDRAIVSMSQNKWERFGYWASTVVHLRKILGLSNTASPFRDYAEIARQQVERDGLKAGGD